MVPQETAISRLERQHHVNFYVYFICIFAALGATVQGATQSVITTTLGQPSFYKALNINDSNEKTLVGLMNSLYFAGGVFGAICHGYVADRYGRKIDICIGTTIIVVSQALIAGSVHPAMFIVFRFFLGWGGFQNVAAVPLLIAEIAPPRHRGMLCQMGAAMITVGYAATGYVGVGFYFLDSANAWRGPLALSLIPGVILLAGIYWIPESPRFLISKDRNEEAWQTLRFLHSDARDGHDELARLEYYQIYKQTTFDASLDGSWRAIFTRPSYRKRAAISVSLVFCAMSSGLMTSINYGVKIYSQLGYGEVETLLFSAGYMAWGLVVLIAATFYVDRVKRPRLMGIGFTGCCVALIIQVAMLANFLGSGNQAGLAAAVFGIFLYMTFFNGCLEGPEFFYHAEIWPTHLRAKGLTLGMAVYSGTNIIWLQAAPTALVTIEWKYYIFFIVFAAIGALACFFVYPDTLHKPLEEVAAIFGDEDLVQVYQRDLHGDTVVLEGVKEEVDTVEVGGRKEEMAEELC